MIQPGGVIRVKNWPGTARRKFVVKAVHDDRVDALDQDQRLRTFPVELCVVVRR